METPAGQENQAFTAPRVCPWSRVRMIDNFVRRMIHNPRKLFARHVEPGMTVLDVGCGGGFVSMGLANLVGEEGRVIAADFQPEMLAFVEKRAKREGLADRIRLHRCEKDRIGVEEELDFCVAFFMVHETPDQRAFLEEIGSLLKPEGALFVAEPVVHVARRDFEKTVELAGTLGLKPVERPQVPFGQAVLFRKG